jgi:hypothetical protein
MGRKMTVICKIYKCAFCITTMIIFYAVILHLIAHPGTFLPRSHQYPTELNAELQKTYCDHRLRKSDFAELWGMTS